MNRENLNIDKYVLAGIMGWSQKDKCSDEQVKECENYKLIFNNIYSVDEENGGYCATAIINRLSDNKFFSLDYQEWDYDWEKGDFNNYNPELLEVFPKTITTTIYE